MKTFFAFVLLLLSLSPVMAQNEENTLEQRPLNSVGVTILGDASIFSFSYENQYFFPTKNMFASKIGLGYNEEFEICLFGSCNSPAEKYITIPHHFTANFGKKRHFFEAGFGGAFIMGKTTQPYIFYPIIGYRFLPLVSNKINFRVFGHIPVTGIDTEDILFMPFGLNLGMSF